MNGISKVVAALLAGVMGIGLATGQSQTQMPGERPTDLIAADLEIPEPVFIACFAGVHPAGNHDPSGAEQRANKAILLPCLQKTNPSIDNDRLDQVMDRYRPEGPNGG